MQETNTRSALRTAFETVVGPLGAVGVLDAVLQVLALARWNPFGHSWGPVLMMWYLVLGIAVLAAVPLGLMCAFSRRPAISLLGAVLVLLFLANLYRFAI